MRLTPLALAPLAAARSVTLTLALALGPALAGCGQKGPLVMPDTDTSNVVIRPSATPATPTTPTDDDPTAPRTDPAPRH